MSKPFWIYPLTLLSVELGSIYASGIDLRSTDFLIFKLDSPSRFVVLMKHTPSSNPVFKHSKSAGNSSLSLTLMISPTLISFHFILLSSPISRPLQQLKHYMNIFKLQDMKTGGSARMPRWNSYFHLLMASQLLLYSYSSYHLLHVVWRLLIWLSLLTSAAQTPTQQ